MAEENQQESQKTLVAFVVGLLIGGMLVWAFSGPSAAAPVANDEATDADTETAADTDEAVESTDQTATGNKGGEEAPAPTLSVGEGKIVVKDQPASSAIELDSATYPVGEGWVGVREYNNEQLGFILGVVRFSESQGLVPTEIILQRSTTPGREYAIVVFTEDGDFDFSLAGDVQIDQIFDTFKAE